MKHSIRTATPEDADAITSIYNHYVAHTVVTFEEEPVRADDMRRRMKDVFASSLPWLVAESDGRIAGYAYATKWKARSAYRFSAETTVYLADGLGKQGLGTRLYDELFRRLKGQGIHAAIGGIALPNEASVALHEKFGMRKVAHFEQVGFKFGKWVDVAYWERIL
jgi:phosphinothricin acetyltransferase